MKIISFVISSIFVISSNMMSQVITPVNTNNNNAVYEETDTAETNSKGRNKPLAPKPPFPPIQIPPIINHK